MSRASKIFLGTSTVVSVGVIWGVHYMQKRESDTMYQGVIRDEARLREKALKLQQQTSSPSTNNAPLNTPSSPVQQPAPVQDADCETCKISPPPQLLESQSPDQRRREREARAKEYEDQKGLGERLIKEQGHSGSRMV